MRIYDQDNDKAIDRVTLFLTDQEASVVMNYLRQLLETPDSVHFHASSDDYRKEITLTIVREHQLHLFHPRAQDVWRKDQ